MKYWENYQIWYRDIEWADAVGKVLPVDLLDTKLPQTFSRWKSVVSAKCKRKLQQNEMCLYAASVSTSICTPVSAPAGSFASVYITSPSLHLILCIHPVSMSTQLASAGPTQIHSFNSFDQLLLCLLLCYKLVAIRKSINNHERILLRCRDK